MKRNALLSVIILSIILIMISCNSYVKKDEYEKIQKELAFCRDTIEELRNTPQKRLLAGQELIAKRDYANAKNKLKELIEKYPRTSEALEAESLLSQTANMEKQEKEAEAKKKALGYKVLKETSTVTIDNITLTFKSITTGNQWIFNYDKYDYYQYRTAECNQQIKLPIFS